MSKIEKSYEYKSIQCPVRKEGMKKRFINCESYDNYDGYGPHYWYHGWEKSGQMSKNIERFIEKHIGEPFSEVYSKFLKIYKSPDKYICRNTKRNMFLNCFSKNFKRIGSYEGEYYLDDDGKIQKHGSTKVNHKINKTPILFKWNKSAYPITAELISILKVAFGDNESIITERVYNETEKENLCRKIKSNEYVRYGFGNDYTKTICKRISESYNTNNPLFIPIKYEDIEPTSFKDSMKKYYTYKQELKQLNKYRKLKRSYDGELYLRTYKQKRKEQENEENDITIERLGFDKLTSFRGLEYHGQKRKKQNSL